MPLSVQVCRNLAQVIAWGIRDAHSEVSDFERQLDCAGHSRPKISGAPGISPRDAATGSVPSLAAQPFRGALEHLSVRGGARMPMPNACCMVRYSLTYYVARSTCHITQVTCYLPGHAAYTLHAYVGDYTCDRTDAGVIGHAKVNLSVSMLR